MPRPAPQLLIASRCARTMLSQRRALAHAAMRQGFKVVAVGEDTDNGCSARKLEREGIAFHAIPVRQGSLNPIALALLILQFIKVFRKIKPDIFHAFTVKPVIAGMIAAKICGINVRVATIPGLGHGFLSKSKIISRTIVLLYKISLSVCDHIFFYNRHDWIVFSELNIVNAKKTSIVNGSGVNTEYFKSSKITKNTEVFKFLFIGRLIKEKGINDLIQAAAIIRNNNRLISIDIVGEIDKNNPSTLTEKEIFLAKSMNIVHFKGQTNDVRPFIEAANAIVLPSYREGIPLVLLEGAAMGRPLVATNVPGCSDVVRPGETGYLVPAGDPEALAAAMMQMAENPSLARSMGDAARQDAIARFSDEAVSSVVLERYSELLARHSAFDA